MKSEPSRVEQIAALRGAIESQPNSAALRFKLGTLLANGGQLNDAKEELERALELDAEHYQSWVNLGGIHFARWDFRAAAEANRAAIKCDAEAGQAHYNLGLCHLYLNQADDMVRCFRRVIELDPENAGAHYHLAAGLNALGEIDEARSSLQRSRGLGYSPNPSLIKDLEKALSKRESDGGVISFEIDNQPRTDG